jgi:hypothetical protein
MAKRKRRGVEKMSYWLPLSLISLYSYLYLQTGKYPFQTWMDDYKPYQYYELAIQKWCQKGYQIHGLWPQYDASSYPTNCPAPVYQNVEGELFDEMEKYWHNCDSTQDFWNHEYTKHLSCIYQQYGIQEYDAFQLTLSLFEELTDSDFEKCQNADDCIVACYNLYLEKIPCPS